MRLKNLLSVFLIFISIQLNAQKSIEPLIDSLKTYLEKNKIPGAMISIVKSDTILFSGGLGYANIEKKEEVTGSHLFRLGSISKSFTSLGILKLVGEEKLQLDTPIKEIDEEIPFSNPWESESKVTVEHLLEHTSGFDGMHLHAIYNKNDSITPTTKKMIYSHRKSLITRWKPGERMAYSNPGYVVAGHILETVSNESYEVYLKNKILLPLGMKNSGFYFKEPQNKKMTQGYQRRGENLFPISFTSIQGGPAGELCSNADEMSKYLQFMLNRDGEKIDSRYFKNSVFDRIENSKTTISAKSGMSGGYGLGNKAVWKNGYLFNGHSGGIDGFSSRYVYSREADLGVTVSINRNGNATAIVNEILSYFLGKSQTASPNRKTFPIPSEIKENYANFYRFSSSRHKLLSSTDRMLAGVRFNFANDSVIVNGILGKYKCTLFYAGNNQFYRNNEGVPSVMALTSSSGNPIFWFNENYLVKESQSLRIIKFTLIAISFILPILFFIYASIWMLVQRISKKGKTINNHLILWSTCLSYLIMFLTFSQAMGNPQTGGVLDFNAILMFVSSIIFVLLAIWSLLRIRKIPKWNFFKVYYLITSLSVIILSIFFITNGFVGFRIWAY
jgi:CubicO group peptidase (beta-lactamase class C family)